MVKIGREKMTIIGASHCLNVIGTTNMVQTGIRNR